MVAITQPRLFEFDRPVRLPEVVYRRRRLLVLGVALVLAALVLASVSSLTTTMSPPFSGEPAATVTYFVEPGDTVWSIAESLAPGEDPRPIVDAIVEANGGAGIVAGQRLVLDVP